MKKSIEMEVMEVIRKDKEIPEDIKGYLQWVFSHRNPKQFWLAVEKSLGYIPF